MGRGAATAVGMDDAPVTLDQSVDGLTKVVRYESSSMMRRTTANVLLD